MKKEAAKLIPARIRKQGSVYLIAIGVLSIFVIAVFLFSKTSISRRWTTRFSSAESKAESVAEAAIDIGLRSIKNQMNFNRRNSSAPLPGEWYEIFRVPGKITSGGLSTSAGDDIPMEENPNFQATPWIVKTKVAPSSPDLKTLSLLIDQNEGSMTVTLEAGISEAYAFAAKGQGFYNPYHVAGIDTSVVPVHANSPAEFLDKQAGLSPSAPSLSDQLSNYRFNLRLPSWTSNTDNDSAEVKLGPFTVKLDFQLKMEGQGSGAPSDHLKINMSIWGIPFPEQEINIYDEFLKQYLDPPGTPNKDKTPSQPAERFDALQYAKKIMAPPNWTGFSWSGKWPLKVINDEISALPPKIKPTSDAFQSDQVVEKNGMIKLTATVCYQPQINGKMIKRMLTAERDFKVSDIQPVAPEYVFFIANSKLPYENSTGISANENETIELISPPPKGQILATTTIHPIPMEGSSPGKFTYNILKDAFSDSGSHSDTMHLPGMIRINGTNKMLTQAFLGTLEEIKTTSFNALMSNRKGQPQNVEDMIDPVFNWHDSPSPIQEENIPYLSFTPGPETFRGFLSMFEIYQKSYPPVTPTLFYGDYFMEYPLSLKTEAFLAQQYSKFSLAVEPIIDAGPLLKYVDLLAIPPSFDSEGLKNNPDDLKKADQSKIATTHTHPEAPFGTMDFPAYDPGSTYVAWDPKKANSLPPNLYSPLQYAKKATYYYKTTADFEKDISKRLDSDGFFICDGITFVDGPNVNIPTMKVKGNGLIVAKQNITVNGEITRDTSVPPTVFGLIARNGAILANTSRIEAACYSNLTLENHAGNVLFIDGNLVMNHFDRALFNSVQVVYNGPACRNSLLSITRNVGKYEPLRYYVSLGKQWTRFEYEKQ